MELLSSNWLYVVVLGIMVFMMFRGSGFLSKYKQNESNNFQEVKDPLCGMIVKPDTAVKQILDGKTYYFCSKECSEEFAARYYWSK